MLLHAGARFIFIIHCFFLLLSDATLTTGQATIVRFAASIHVERYTNVIGHTDYTVHTNYMYM